MNKPDARESTLTLLNSYRIGFIRIFEKTLNSYDSFTTNNTNRKTIITRWLSR